MLAGEIHLAKLTYSTYYLLVRSASETEATMCATEMQSYQPLAEGKVIDTFLLTAIKVFYAQNIISVDIELFKLQGINSPAASDLSLTKRLAITFNGASKWRDQFARSFNTINLRNLFTRCAATFPALEGIVVHTDGATLPCTSLIDIFQDCHNSQNIFTTIDFCNVGQFVATTHSGLTLTVKFKELADLWQEICDLSSSTEMRVSPNFVPTDNFLANLPHQRNLAPQVNQAREAFLIKTVYDEVRDDDASEQMDTFRKAMVQHSPSRAMPYLNDNVFWTNLASPYVWYAPN